MATPGAVAHGTLRDLQFDLTGQRFATASADDNVVRIWRSGSHEPLSELREHKAPVACLSWGGSRLNSLLASASGGLDGHVIIWREVAPGNWQACHQAYLQGPLTALEFCPAESGLVLAAGAGDELGILTVLARQATSITTSTVQPKSDQWQSHPLPAHDGGIVALSWAPACSPTTLATGPAAGRAAPVPRRLVTAGVDGRICVWRCQGKLDSWERQHELADEQHVGNVRDVAWRPNLGLPTSLVATCTDDGTVATWVQELDGHPWRLQACWRVPGDARRLCWSAGGVLLCVSVDEASSLMFKEVVGGQWEQLEPAER